MIAPDSFKGSLNAIEVAESIERGVRRAYPEADTLKLPVGDGGEGTMDVLVAATGGEIRTLEVTGPLGNSVEASYGIMGDRETCVIEMASASGLHLVSPDNMDVLKATSYGTGELIRHALDEGFSCFVICIGGSATNDGGVGMLQAFGMKIYDEQNSEIGFGGGELHRVKTLDPSTLDHRISGCSFIIASDVQNPLIGPEGASHIFGPQKGATEADVAALDKGMSNWADCVLKTTGVKLHDRRGAGAAGGIGGAFQAFFPSDLQSGIDVVLDQIKLDAQLESADLVITGEGRVDHQTIFGKTPMGVAQRAQRLDIPTVIVAGSVGEGADILHDLGVIGIHSIINEPMTLEQAMENTSRLLENTAFQVTRSHFYKETVEKGGLHV
ncbi:glycerate kinase [Salinicoccus cyprini]|uniref:glycerate kinase family protein n=1 Tax=Salinicoccus cyprini TaxID=2493691 RepID=UPI00319DE2CF